MQMMSCLALCRMLGVGRDALSGAVGQLIDLELAFAGLIEVVHHGGLAIDPARVGIPFGIRLSVSDHFEIGNRALLGIEVSNVKDV